MATAAPPRVETHGEKRRTAQTDQGPVAYTAYGSPDGTPVVFLHGTPGSRRLAGLFDAAARERDVRLLAPDRPGYGRSPAWTDRSVDDAGRIVAAVLDDAGVETAGLVGFSGGGPQALAAAATHPDRVTGVDVISGATPPESGSQSPPLQRLLAGLASRTPTVLGGLLRGQAWLAGRLDPSVVVAQYTAEDRDRTVPEDVAETVRADFVEAFAGGAGGAVTEFRTAATDWEVPFGEITPDVGLYHGEHDRNAPVEGARELAARIPQADLEVLGTDHLGTLLEVGPEVLADHCG